MCVLHVILLLVAILSQSNCYDRNKQLDLSVECFVTYLKQQNVDDEFLNNVRVTQTLSDACDKGVSSEKDQLFIQTKSNLQYQENSDCMIELMDNENYKNLLLKLSAVKKRSEGFVRRIERMWIGMKTPKKKAEERVEKELQDHFESAKMTCKLKIGFEEVFDSFFDVEYEVENFVPYEDVEDFCIKKELADKNFINLTQYRIKMSPKNIKVDSLDCSKILEPIKINMITSLNDFQSENIKKQKNRCAFQVLNDDNDYFHLMLKAEILSKLSLKQEQKQLEKTEFVNKMIEISKKIDETCNKP